VSVAQDDVLVEGLPRRLDLAVAWAIFVPLAYLPNFAPKRSVNLVALTIFWAFFTMTFIILCDQITVALDHRSLLQEATGSGRAWLSLLTVGALGGLLLDGIAQWLGKLWIYPYWNEAVYGSTFIVGFCAYWLATAESYLAVKAILKRCRRAAPPAITARLYEPALFRALGLTGLVLIAAGVALLLREYRTMGGYVFEIRTPLPVEPHISYFVMAFVGIWFALEWIQFARGNWTLLRAVLHGYRLPLYALIAASAVCSIFWETVNASHHFWIYTNWPFPQWQLMSIPVTVLLTWPLQYVVFLSLGFIVGSDFWR
jgi:hypothetical protein